MKKILLFVLCTFMCVIASHAQVKRVEVAPAGLTPTMMKPIGVKDMARAPRKATADDMRLGKKFRGTCYQYTPATGEFDQQPVWDVTRSVQEIQGRNYDVMYDVLPSGIFTVPVPTIFYVSGNKVIVPPQLLAEVNGKYVCAIDYQNLIDGGTGAIELEVDEYGNMSIPENRQFDTYGYYLCTVNPDGESISCDGSCYMMCAMLTYECTEQYKGEIVPPTGEVRSFTFDSRIEGNDVKWSDHVADRGYWQMMANDGKSFVSISPIETYVYEGEYPMDELDTQYTYFFKPMGEGKIIGVEPSDMHATLTIEDGTIVAKLSVMEWSTGIEYQATCIYASEEAGIREVDSTDGAPRKMLRDGQLVITRDGHEYNVAGGRLK